MRLTLAGLNCIYAVSFVARQTTSIQYRAKTRDTIYELRFCDRVRLLVEIR